MTDKKLLKKTLTSLYEKNPTIETFNAVTEAMRRKIDKKLIYSSITEDVFYAIKNEVIAESVLDPIQNKRSEGLFGNDELLKLEVLEFIKKTSGDWMQQLDIKFKVVEMNGIGSSMGFQYRDNSDVDVNIFTDLDAGNLAKVRKLLPNGNIIPGTKHPLNFWIGNIAEKKDKNFEGIYDILSNSWVRKPEKSSHEFPFPYILELSKFFMNAFDLSLSQYERDKGEINIYRELSPEKQQISQKEIDETISRKLVDLKADLDMVRMGKHILNSFMREGYEFPFKVNIEYKSDDPRYSVNSLVYKMVERYGYQEKLTKAIEEAKEIIASFEKK
jgi:hypothetical protein